MPLQGYMLSLNTANNVDPDHVAMLHNYLTQIRKDLELYVIAIEHIHQTIEKKDHIQCFFRLNLDTITQPCAIKKHIKYHVKAFEPMNSNALHINKHKGGLDHGLGYCLKEVPETGRIAHTNLTDVQLKQYRELYDETSKKETILETNTELFFKWLKLRINSSGPRISEYYSVECRPYKFIGPMNRHKRFYDRGDWERVPDFKPLWDEFICEKMIQPSRAEYYKISLSFRGMYRGYLLLGFDSPPKNKNQ